MTLTFTATLQLDGRTATGIVVPDDIVEALAAGRRPPVRVTLGAHTYRSTIATRDGAYKLPVSSAERAAAGLQAGDDVSVAIELDTEPREVAVPGDLAAALDTAARAHFAGLSYSKRRAFVLSVEGAKTPETRERRIAKAAAVLAAGRDRP